MEITMTEEAMKTGTFKWPSWMSDKTKELGLNISEICRTAINQAIIDYNNDPAKVDKYTEEMNETISNSKSEDDKIQNKLDIKYDLELKLISIKCIAPSEKVNIESKDGEFSIKIIN